MRTDITYEERVARIMFLREHRRNLLRGLLRRDNVPKREKNKLQARR